MVHSGALEPLYAKSAKMALVASGAPFALLQMANAHIALLDMVWMYQLVLARTALAELLGVLEMVLAWLALRELARHHARNALTMMAGALCALLVMESTSLSELALTARMEQLGVQEQLNANNALRELEAILASPAPLEMATAPNAKLDLVLMHLQVHALLAQEAFCTAKVLLLANHAPQVQVAVCA